MRVVGLKEEEEEDAMIMVKSCGSGAFDGIKVVGCGCGSLLR